MKEAYVKFETARLLKEKEFDWELRTYYNKDGDELTLHDDFADMSNSEVDTCDPDYIDYLDIHCTRPTQQMAMRWLREKKMIFISPFPTFKSMSTFKSMLPYSWRVGIKSCFGEELGGNYEYVTYEDAVEAALEYVLKNLI